MLTVDEITEVWLEGVDVVVKRQERSDLFGLWDPSDYKILIYLLSMRVLEDLDLTLIHEIIHARDDLLYGSQRPEMVVDYEALDTYFAYPRIADFIKEIYSIENPKALKRGI